MCSRFSNALQSADDIKLNLKKVMLQNYIKNYDSNFIKLENRPMYTYIYMYLSTYIYLYVVNGNALKYK